MTGMSIQGYAPPPPDFLSKWLGTEFFSSVETVSLSQPADLTRVGFGDGRTTVDVGEEEMRSVGQFSQLKYLRAAKTSVNDDGLRHLRNCPHLKMLVLDDAPIGDVGIASLRDLTELTHLS